jgi:hypothetical protein
MRPDLVLTVSSVLAGVGAAFQFLRANRRIADIYIIALGVVSSIVLWVLCADWTKAAADWQSFILNALLVICTNFCPSLFGGTFIASKGANAAVALGANESNPLVPVTDSKG